MDLSVRTDTFLEDGQDWLGSARGMDTRQTCNLYVPAFTANIHYPNGFFPSGLKVAKYTSGAHSGLYGPITLSVNAVQTITITGTPTGGTFTVTFDGVTTAAVAYNATAAALQAALEALPNISPNEAIVTGGPGPATPYVITFSGGPKAGKLQPVMTVTSSFTGGTSPAIAVVNTTTGGSGVTDGSDSWAGCIAFAVRAPYFPSTAQVVSASLLETGKVINALLPIPLSAFEIATNPRFVVA